MHYVELAIKAHVPMHAVVRQGVIMCHTKKWSDVNYGK